MHTVEVLNSTSIGPFNYYWQDSTGDTISGDIFRTIMKEISMLQLLICQMVVRS